MKRYELVEDEECKDLFLLEGKTTSSGMCDRVDAGKGLIAAYTLAFAIMYEDREGRINVDKLLSDIVLKELHTFMDAYQCYGSRSMRLRLQSLILESPMIGPMGINAESPRFIPIGKGLRSPDIYMHAVRGAALGHYFSQRKNSKHPYLKRDYDENTMEIMKFWAAKIAEQYDPIVDELDKLASTAIAQLQVHHKVSSPMTGESRIFRSAAKWILLHRAELYSLHSFDPAEGTCGTQNWLWDMYSQPHKFAHEPCKLCPCTNLYEDHEFLLSKAREILSPLYKDMWIRESHAGPSSMGKMLNCRSDPVPCIQKELAEAARSIVKEKQPCLTISVGQPVEIVPENREARKRIMEEELEHVLEQLGFA